MCKNDLWVKEVDEPILKPLNVWRDELNGYWMVVTDECVIDGKNMAIARYYGTDEDKLYDIWDELCLKTEEPTVSIRNNKKSNWMGGAFIVKA